MRVLAALALLCCAVMAACATPPRADDRARTCAVLADVFSTPSTTMWPQLSARDEARTDAMSVAELPRSGYVCGDTTYRDAGRGNQVFREIGFSTDGRYASIGLGSADYGQRCLLRGRDERWRVVGCRMLWIS